MREIKFRAWFEEDKRMFSERTLDIVLHMNGRVNLIEANGKIVGSSNVPEFKIMQYTGLKDKNGKDIYEGDILKVPDLYETPEYTYPTYHYEKVIYDNQGFGFGTENAMFYEDGDYISEECEVVGNTYENPELLK